MNRLSLKISVITIVFIFLGAMLVSMVSDSGSNSHYFHKSYVKGSEDYTYLNSNSDPSVHLYVNGNGYVVFSANYTVGGIIHNSFDNARSENFSTNDIPTGTVFHLVSSPNSGYIFQKWTGSVNSTNSSIYVVVNENINEEAIYVKTSYFPVSFIESGLPASTVWYVNISGQPTSGPITKNSYNISLQNGSYMYFISTSDKDYAPNKYSGSLSVNGSSVSVPPINFTLKTYELSFNEAGLPLGTWYVNLSDGQQGSAAAGTPIVLSVPNGTYSYIVATSNKEYQPSYSAGSLVVAGNTSLKILFNQTTYVAQFKESGLPTGTTWYVNLSNGMDSGAITGSSYSISLANGTYSYSVSTSNKTYESSPSAGSFTVKGTQVSQYIIFSEVNYTDVFSESGLPLGTTWYINLTNGQSFFSQSDKFSFSEPNGTYTYKVATSNKTFSPYPSSGSFMVNGASVSEYVAFSEVLYKVKFTESGLPSGSAWYVNLTNGMDSGPLTGPSYSISLANGTYSYTVSSANKTYSPLQSSSSVTVKGAPVSVPVTFSKYTYKVTFTESGLPSGSAWYVNLTNGMDSGAITGTLYSLSLTNGTYPYTIATSDKIYEPSPSSGSFPVNGGSVSKLVSFSEVKYAVSFTESGLPSGTSWSVTLFGTTESSTTNTITFSLPNGTYSYTVGSVPGYSVSPSSGSITVNGSSIAKTIAYTTFSVPPSKTPPSGISNIEIYGITGAVVAVAAIGAGIAVYRRRR